MLGVIINVITVLIGSIIGLLFKKKISDKINNLSEEEFKVWVKYQLSICEREDLIGYRGHILAITKKK